MIGLVVPGGTSCYINQCLYHKTVMKSEKDSVVLAVTYQNALCYVHIIHMEVTV